MGLRFRRKQKRRGGVSGHFFGPFWLRVGVRVRALISGSASVARLEKVRYLREYTLEHQVTNCV